MTPTHKPHWGFRILRLVGQYAKTVVLLSTSSFSLNSIAVAIDRDCAEDDPYVASEHPQAAAPLADHAAFQEGDPSAVAADGAKEQPWSIVSLFDRACGRNGLKDRGITLGGWVQFGYQNNPDGAFTGNGPFLDDREWNRVNLNQSYLFFQRVVDETKSYDWGFRTDILYGVDGYNTQAIGGIDNTGTIRKTGWDFENGWDHGIYEWTMPQLYGEIAADDVSVKLGHFYAIVGYESTPAPNNFFLSHNIAFYNSEPFTYTGALATWKASEQLSFSAGWALGFDTGFYQFQNGNTGLFSLTYNPNDDTSFNYAGNYGNFGWRGTGMINGVIVSHKWTDKLESVHQLDVLQTDNGTSFGGPSASGITGDSIGQINYLFYDLHDMLRLGLRQEWYKADGISYHVITYGVNIKPHQNIIIRPEMRHMFANTTGGPGLAENIDEVYGGNNVFGIDLIFQF